MLDQQAGLQLGHAGAVVIVPSEPPQFFFVLGDINPEVRQDFVKEPRLAPGRRILIAHRDSVAPRPQQQQQN